ncbi:MAG: hypothetical protein EOO04_16330 [Chitinophagaceae bacterium]|nr:MAG: hypothetical protein EOO04_16330 [Chitinophagaceae bacterium]
MNTPFTKFTGNLKYTRPELVTDEFSKDCFQFVAPRFYTGYTEGPQDEKKIENNEYLKKRAAEGGLEYGGEDSELKQRRFAGDSSLSRGAYFGICSEGTEWDHGLVTNEINFYRNPETCGFTIVGDLYDQPVADVYNNGIREKSFIILIDRVDLFLKQYPKYKDRVSNNTPFYSKYPYAVKHSEIDNVIDLRLPATRDWFYKKFVIGDGTYFLKDYRFFRQHKDKPQPESREGQKLVIIIQGYHENIKTTDPLIDSFYKMLPALMHLDHGGFYETRGIGLWMRKNKVNALIFPSARTNVFVQIENGKLIDHWGWNIVDYRGSGDTTIDQFFDWSPWFNRRVFLISDWGMVFQCEVKVV